MKAIFPALSAAACLIGIIVSSAAAQAPGGPPPGREGREGGEGRPGRDGRFGGRMPGSPILQALDTDGDGELSPKEIEHASAALMTLDKDKNGKLTTDELRPAFGGPGGRGPGGGGGPGAGRGGPGVAEQLVNQVMTFDKNGDGKLARDELPERMQVLMDRADANKDGFVDKAELTTFAERASRPGPGEGREDFGRPEGGRDGAPGPGPGGAPRRRPRPQANPTNRDA